MAVALACGLLGEVRGDSQADEKCRAMVKKEWDRNLGCHCHFVFGSFWIVGSQLHMSLAILSQCRN